MKILLLLGAMVFFVVFTIFQFVLGFLGIEHHLGMGIAILALIGLFIFKFTLPFTIGSFFGAVNVLGLHWVFGLIIAIPGIALMVPGALLLFFSPVITKYNLNKFKKVHQPSPFDDGDVIEGSATVVNDDAADEKK